MNLPLFKSPGTVVLLDDDAAFLEMMALVLPSELSLRLLLRPVECISHLAQQRTSYDAEYWQQQEIVDRWRKIRIPLVTQILDYWNNNSTRYSLARVAVVDYSMPAMNGLQVLQSLNDWPGTRVLLTGRADEQIAVEAFNRGLIQQFIPKQASDMVQRLLAALHQLPLKVESRITQIWRSTLSPQQYALLELPSIARELIEFSDRHWVEHVVLGSPFGMLGRNAAGHVGWLQLEAASHLDELADLVEGVLSSSTELEDIRQGRKLSDYELCKALGSDDSPDLKPAFWIGSEEPVLGAFFPLDPRFSCFDSSFERFLSQQPARQVEH